MHVFVVHVQPVPAIDARVSPTGSVSVTVTVPAVGPAVAALLTAIVYVAPFCPCAKLPTCDLATVSAAGLGLITVESDALAVADPPPDTLAEFTSGEAAVAATFTVTVIPG